MSDNSKDVVAIVDLFEQSDWDELHIELDGLHLFLSRRADAQLTSGIGGGLAAAPAAVAAPAAAAPAAPAAAPAASAPAASAPAADSIPANWVAVTAPNLGTFYRAPKPGAAPFVEIGQQVTEDTEICLLEVMKLFTAVKAGVSGKVVQVCVNDADMVEHGQPLFYVEKA
ncbi:acetyl-CoA carboxylase biotin carboxyl carrier protein [Tsuneonella sp. CC-YZS046]|uniref:acetyl-CoA carboxylase biotin carboxyl carrier protein n=1 Tax=Tsuneonella sp. CC-YZS046 TaxID=3042152 RepID=UPI002D775267|nr:acetyl-CoA carboxylase biotin carboxyl carrier protein [Tsuneonella sp. CC-YZS046]WRO66478.1 acetyl-CoA carboxylase biotin carboxyl carrier protein [Tsuneonella sp. CC-YZS046]